MIRILLLFFFVTVSWAQQKPIAKLMPVCQKCTEEWRIKKGFGDTSHPCRGCIYKIYDELKYGYPESYSDLYCGCELECCGGGGGNIHFNSVGCFEPSDRASFFDNSVDLEHVFPKSRFGNDNYLSTDMHNLFPAIGIINTDRNTKDFADYDSEDSTRIRYGNCETFIQGDKIYPRFQVKGVIARAYLYMADQAKKRLGFKEDDVFPDPYLKQIMSDWNLAFPPNAIECKREKLIYEIQGNHNWYISNHLNCKNIR